jgi:hypothetical protein
LPNLNRPYGHPRDYERRRYPRICAICGKTYGAA